VHVVLACSQVDALDQKTGSNHRTIPLDSTDPNGSRADESEPPRSSVCNDRRPIVATHTRSAAANKPTEIFVHDAAGFDGRSGSPAA